MARYSSSKKTRYTFLRKCTGEEFQRKHLQASVVPEVSKNMWFPGPTASYKQVLKYTGLTFGLQKQAIWWGLRRKQRLTVSTRHNPVPQTETHRKWKYPIPSAVSGNPRSQDQQWNMTAFWLQTTIPLGMKDGGITYERASPACDLNTWSPDGAITLISQMLDILRYLTYKQFARSVSGAVAFLTTSYELFYVSLPWWDELSQSMHQNQQLFLQGIVTDILSQQIH